VHAEDYLVVAPSGVEAVSVKHREDKLAAWSVASLCGDGKLALRIEPALALQIACDLVHDANREKIPPDA
jgi:hypothetical protein